MSGVSEVLEQRPDGWAGRAAEAARLRAWNLDRAVLLEYLEPGADARYVIKCGESWAWCADLDGALSMVWRALRMKAALPAQWVAAEAELVGEFRSQWPKLQQLPAGQWRPEPPAAPA